MEATPGRAAEHETAGDICLQSCGRATLAGMGLV